MASVAVEVVYAFPERQERIALRLAAGSTVADAIAASGLLARHGLTEASLKLGLGGQVIAADRRLADGDRIDILRRLAEDPKDARRRRAAAKRR
jgi:putative ubiquitin-RnfH superfamily antitoxin RatB of RatAB toxin-antitoxin module